MKFNKSYGKKNTTQCEKYYIPEMLKNSEGNC